MITTERVATDFFKSGEIMTTRVVAKKYGITASQAGVIINNIEAFKKYTIDVQREGRIVKSLRVIGIDTRKTYYKQVREDLQASGEFATPSELVERYGMNYQTAQHITLRLRRDPKIKTEERKDGQAIAVRIIKEEAPKLSREDILWRALTTKRWSEIARVAA